MEIVTVDNFEFWFMGFLNYQKAIICLHQALSQSWMSYKSTQKWVKQKHFHMDMIQGEMFFPLCFVQCIYMKQKQKGFSAQPKTLYKILLMRNWSNNFV